VCRLPGYPGTKSSDGSKRKECKNYDKEPALDNLRRLQEEYE